MSREPLARFPAARRILFPAPPTCGIIPPHTAISTIHLQNEGGIGERTIGSSRTGLEFHGAPG
jgi:hypothetical protein